MTSITATAARKDLYNVITRVNEVRSGGHHEQSR